MSQVRLSDAQIKTLKHAILTLDKTAQVFLFGSRVDASKQGGDIDILIISSCLDRCDIRLIRQKFYDCFGEQKLDLVIDDGHANQAFIKMIKPQAVLL